VTDLPFIDVVGFWIGIFLTFCILSYLYKDNPFYKLAEHLFVGISIGYIVCKQYYDVFRPNLIDRLGAAEWAYLFPLLLVLLLFLKAVSPKLSWLGRYPLAFVVALYAGIQINAVAQSDLAEQIKASIKPLGPHKVDVTTAPAKDMSTLPGFSPPVAKKVEEHRAAGGRIRSLDDLVSVPGLTEDQKRDIQAARGPISGLDAHASVGPGGLDWYQVISRFLLLVGLIASLVYFYFSIEQKGPVGKISRVGIWVLMLGFGAAFGYTVQGRLALAVGRAMDVLDKDKSAEQAAQIRGPIVAIVSIVIIVVGIVAWERWPRRPAPPPQKPVAGDDLPEY
jgi:hypothetical protein